MLDRSKLALAVTGAMFCTTLHAAPENAETASANTATAAISTPSIPRLHATQAERTTPTVISAPSQPSRPPLTCASDFQKYLCRSAGIILPIYGQRLFSEGDNLFAAPASSAVAPGYLLNVGDEIALRIWGQLDAELDLKVDRSGAVFIPRVGNISVVGVPFGNLKQHLTKEIGRVFRNFDLAVTMGQLRTAQVFVVGFANKPGSYTLSSLSTVVNALMAAGGPSEAGSLRNIQIKRGNQVVKQFDLYDLLLKGDKSADVLLQSGDVIFVPPAGQQVAIYGSVNAPAIYELKGQETLKDLIALAGGTQLYAQDGQISVERLNEQKGRLVESVSLKDASQFALRGGDVAQIYSITSRVDQVVSLRGNVAQPVRMAWRKGMKISDLIASREMLQSPGYWENKNRVDADTATEKAARSVRTDLNEINWDYALIERVNPQDYSTRLLSFSLIKALEKDAANDLTLESGDIVSVFSKNDIQINSSKRTRFVRLEGEVAVPGFYEVKEGETLRDLVNRIGGLTPRAYLFGAEFNREAVRRKQQAELEKYAESLKQEASRQAVATAVNAVRTEAAAGAQFQAQQTQVMADKLKTLQATGRVVLGLKPEDKQATALPTMPLEDGDRLYVPATPGTVEVLGSVFSRNNAFIFQRGKEIEDYIKQAGGPTGEAEETSIHVVRADGSVISAKQKSMISFWSSFASTAALPGDTIVVPEKVDRSTLVKNLMDWTQILANFGLGAAAIKTLK